MRSVGGPTRGRRVVERQVLRACPHPASEPHDVPDGQARAGIQETCPSAPLIPIRTSATTTAPPRSLGGWRFGRRPPARRRPFGSPTPASAANPGWLSDIELAEARRRLPMLYVEAIPVRTDGVGTVTEVGILLRATPLGEMTRTIVTRPGALRRDDPRRAVPPPRERPRADGLPAAAAAAGAVHGGRVLPDAGPQRLPRRPPARGVAGLRRAGHRHVRAASGRARGHLDAAGGSGIRCCSPPRWRAAAAPSSAWRSRASARCADPRASTPIGPFVSDSQAASWAVPGTKNLSRPTNRLSGAGEASAATSASTSCSGVFEAAHPRTSFPAASDPRTGTFPACRGHSRAGSRNSVCLGRR